jgi:hypothetical protein
MQAWRVRAGGLPALASLAQPLTDHCTHAPIYEQVDEFNDRTLAFLNAHSR